MATSRKPHPSAPSAKKAKQAKTLFDPDEKTATEGTALDLDKTEGGAQALPAPVAPAPAPAPVPVSAEPAEVAEPPGAAEPSVLSERSRGPDSTGPSTTMDPADSLSDAEPEERDDAPLTAPPEADVVAGRALMVAALLERARLESSRDAARFTTLKDWVEELGLFGNLGADGVELFEGKLGSWTDEDVESVEWTGEELQLLLWALQKAEFPALDQRAEPAKLLPTLPLLGSADAFIDGAALRSIDELEVYRALTEALLEAIRSEVYARSLQEDPSSLEEDEELEELLASVASEGFDREAAAKSGKANEAVQGLRYWSRSLLNELFASGSPHEAHRIDSAELVGLDEATLATWLGMAHSRSEAMAWLLEGDEYETEGADQEE